MPFDAPRDPLPGCEECPRHEDCFGPHFCKMTRDLDWYDEDKENDFAARRKTNQARYEAQVKIMKEKDD